VRAIDVPRMSPEVPEQLVRVLLLHHHPRRLNDIPHILDQLPTSRRELVDINRGGILDTSEGFVDLLVIGHVALAEGSVTP
jgi:hypothetical protein